MGTVPGNAKVKMEWYEAHVAQFAANAVAIGTTTTATTDLTTKTTAARTKYNAKVLAENAAKVATSDWHGAIGAIRARQKSRLATRRLATHLHLIR